MPWDQALDLVLKTKGLDKRKVGNVLLVAPADEIAARERQELESQKQIADLAPLRRELLQVNYAKAADIAKLFQSVTSAEAKPDERGSITVDERTNNIIAYQTQDRLDELRRIVTQLDIPVRQVMIEARIVEANVDYDKSLGVRWGGSIQNKGNWNTSGVSNGLNGSSTIGTPGSTSTNSPFVDMGVANNTSGIGIAFITDNVLLDLELTAMEKTGNGGNRLTAQSGHVRQGNRENPQGHRDSLSGSQLQRRDFGLVQGGFAVAGGDAADHARQPDHHGGQGHQDEPDFLNKVQDVPPIKKNEVNAKVLVNDGETIVIGGVFSNTQSKVVDKVPFLGDVPYLGRLFRRDVVSEKNPSCWYSSLRVS